MLKSTFEREGGRDRHRERARGNQERKHRVLFRSATRVVGIWHLIAQNRHTTGGPGLSMCKLAAAVSVFLDWVCVCGAACAAQSACDCAEL